MKIWYSRYELFPKVALNRFTLHKRGGFLIRIQTQDFQYGFADCHPLLEFGDQSVEKHLQMLSAKKESALLNRALYLAKIDGVAREERKSLFSHTKIKSHYTCSDIKKLTFAKIQKCLENGFTTFKIKVGRNVKAEAQVVNRLAAYFQREVRWRFDANSGVGDVFLSLLKDSVLEQTDFIEDPTPFRLKKWNELTKKYKIATAFDRPLLAPKNFLFKGIRVVKPAREFLKIRKSDIVTNCMDHPVGQSFAVWAAQNWVDREGTQMQDYGLQTAHLFKTNSFFSEMRTGSCFFKTSSGHGIGFDKLLGEIKWRRI